MKTLIHLMSVMSVIMCWSAGIASAAPQVLFEDTFTTADPAWGFDSGAQIKNGALVIKPNPTLAKNYLYQSDVFTDADISVTVSSPSTDAGAGAGIVFWGTDTDNYYMAVVHGDGTYGISRYVGNRWMSPAPAAVSASVNKGAGAKNKIRVVTTGSQATLYINDKQIVTIKGQPPVGGGAAGVFAESGDQPAVWTLVDFKVLALQ